MRINELLTKSELKIVHQYLPDVDFAKELTDDGMADFEEKFDDVYIYYGFTNEEINEIGRQLEPIVDKLAES
ncbi:hypothetical protein ACNAN0_08365 [Agrilactobacillus fermenti]|uniref:hypothetical protein n=1 Tax=Agrilactobacillus fermenti TaxID=2586909 RepID=UPI001E52592A|nr:hypothetical protein [Agrilactobacillus fermenti]MCD2257259.1 hypothetical protein [Agrilactobacillus fermenti]